MFCSLERVSDGLVVNSPEAAVKAGGEWMNFYGEHETCSVCNKTWAHAEPNQSRVIATVGGEAAFAVCRDPNCQAYDPDWKRRIQDDDPRQWFLEAIQQLHEHRSRIATLLEAFEHAAKGDIYKVPEKTDRLFVSSAMANIIVRTCSPLLFDNGGRNYMSAEFTSEDQPEGSRVRVYIESLEPGAMTEAARAESFQEELENLRADYVIVCDKLMRLKNGECSN